MAESKSIQHELDHFVTGLLSKNVSASRDASAALIGIELMTLGIGMVTKVIGTDEMALHFRRMADQVEKTAADQGYSSMG
jgi:hypothetical protein